MANQVEFIKLNTPITVSKYQLTGLGQLYPYGLWQYTNLKKEGRAFLTKNFSSWKPYLEVIGITNHNGRGRQWGIILFHCPYGTSDEWIVVAQFGHRPGGLRRRVWFAKWLSRFLQYRNQELVHPCQLRSLTQP